VGSNDVFQRMDKCYAVFKKENKPPGFTKLELFLLWLRKLWFLNRSMRHVYLFVKLLARLVGYLAL
jgi:hypothetical protein